MSQIKSCFRCGKRRKIITDGSEPGWDTPAKDPLCLECTRSWIRVVPRLRRALTPIRSSTRPDLADRIEVAVWRDHSKIETAEKLAVRVE